MTLGSSLNLSPLVSQNISFVQVAAFGGLTKAIALLSSYVNRDVSYQKTVRLFSHIAGGVVAYGVTRFLPVRTWIPNFPEHLSWEVAAATTFTIYLFSSSSIQSEKSLEQSPTTKRNTDGNPKAAEHEPATPDEEAGLLAQPDVETLKRKLSEVEQELVRVGNIKKSLEEKSTTLEKKQTFFEDIQRQLTSTTDQLQTTKKANQTLQEQWDALQKEHSKLKDQLAQAQKDTAADKNKSLADVQTDLHKQLQANIDASKAQDEQLKFLEEEQKLRAAEIAQLTRDLESAKSQAVALMAEKSKATSQTAVEYLSSSSTGDLEKKLREVEHKNQSLQSEAEALWAQLQASEQQLEQQLVKHEALLEQHSKSLAEKSAAMEDQEKNYQKLQEKHSSTLKQLKNSEDAYAEMQARWKASEKRMESQLSLIQSSTQKQLKSSEDAYAEMQARWKASEERMKSQLSLMQKGLEEFEQKVTQLNEELAQERQKRAQAEAALQDQLRINALAKTQPHQPQEKIEVSASVKSAVAATFSGGKPKELPETPRRQPPAHVRSPSGSGMMVKRPIPAQEEAVVKLEATRELARSISVERERSEGEKSREGTLLDRDILDWVKAISLVQKFPVPETFTSPEWKSGLALAAVAAFVKSKHSKNKMTLAHLQPANGRKNIELAFGVAQMAGVSAKIEIDEVGVNEKKMREYLQALYQFYHQSKIPTPPPTWNVIEDHLRAMAKAHPENVTKVPERPSLQKQKNMPKLEELNMWMEVLLAFNGLKKPPQMVNRTNVQDWTGYELCAIISLCRPDLLDLKTVDPKDSKKNISLGLKALEKATGKPSLMVEDDYAGETLAMNTLYFDVTNLDADRNILRAIFDIAKR